MAYTSHYPPGYTTTYIKSTSNYLCPTWCDLNVWNPGTSLTGTWASNSWMASWESGSGTLQNRLNVDLGDAYIIKRLYYENNHTGGAFVTSGAKTFVVQGSNSSDAFANVTYATDTDWTTLTASQSTFDQHAALDQADPKYITLTNSTAYRYYSIKIADQWGGQYYGMRRLELQTEDEAPPSGGGNVVVNYIGGTATGLVCNI